MRLRTTRRSVAIAAAFATAGLPNQAPLASQPAYAASSTNLSLTGKDLVLEDIRDNAEMIGRGSEQLKQLEDARLEECRDQMGSKFDECFFFGVGSSKAHRSSARRNLPTW